MQPRLVAFLPDLGLWERRQIVRPHDWKSRSVVRSRCSSTPSPRGARGRCTGGCCFAPAVSPRATFSFFSRCGSCRHCPRRDRSAVPAGMVPVDYRLVSARACTQESISSMWRTVHEPTADNSHCKSYPAQENTCAEDRAARGGARHSREERLAVAHIRGRVTPSVKDGKTLRRIRAALQESICMITKSVAMDRRPRTGLSGHENAEPSSKTCYTDRPPFAPVAQSG